MSDLVNDIFEEVEEALNEEIVVKAKMKLLEKLREQRQAEVLLKNIGREIEELKVEIEHELGQ